MSTALPGDAYAAALAGVTLLGPARLARLLGRWEPEDAWRAVQAGAASSVWGRGEAPIRVAEAAPRVRAAARRLDVARLWERCRAAGVTVLRPGRPSYPAALADDPAPPAVLFALGDTGVLRGRRVTIVGTRNATAVGREVAADLGAGLAAAGVCVVSGLARGVDGWAHRGALSAGAGWPPAAVVASGADVVYPPEHRWLWEAVAARGVLLSEVPPGTAPHGFRFPLRNRILAGLGEAVVVVESRHRGGSLLTVDAALERGVPVFAVPGSPRNPAADGVNQLLVDGATPVLGPGDVLLALGLAPGDDGRPRRGASSSPGPDQWLADLLAGGSCDLDALVLGSGRSLPDVAAALRRLEDAGAIAACQGRFELRGPSSGWPR